MTAVSDVIKGVIFWIPRRIDTVLRGHYTGGAQAERDRQNLERLATALADAVALAERVGVGSSMEPSHRRDGNREVLRVAELGARLNDQMLADRLAAFRREIRPYVERGVTPSGSSRQDVRGALDAAMQRIAEIQARLR